MSVLLSDIKIYAAAQTPEDNAATAIGGDIASNVQFTGGRKKHDFADINTDTLQGVSSNSGDTTQVLTITYRDASGTIQSTTINLNGQTVVANATSPERLLKGTKNATCAGDVAIESATAVRTGTLQGLGLAGDQVVLDAGASGVDGFYNGMVFRATGGTGNHKIAEIIDYVGTSKTATLSRNVSTDFDGTTTFRISKGFFFDKTPDEISYIVRLDYDAKGDPASGSEQDYYQKLFFKHTDASGSGLGLTTCKVVESADPSGDVTFALATAINDTGTNGIGNNRQVAPSSGVTSFDNSDKSVPGGTLSPGDRIGVWVKLGLPAGTAALRTTWTPQFQGTTT